MSRRNFLFVISRCLSPDISNISSRNKWFQNSDEYLANHRRRTFYVFDVKIMNKLTASNQKKILIQLHIRLTKKGDILVQPKQQFKYALLVPTQLDTTLNPERSCCTHICIFNACRNVNITL